MGNVATRRIQKFLLIEQQKRVEPQEGAKDQDEDARSEADVGHGASLSNNEKCTFTTQYSFSRSVTEARPYPTLYPILLPACISGPVFRLWQIVTNNPRIDQCVVPVL